MIYYLNERFPLTNALLIVTDGEVLEGEEQINLKPNKLKTIQRHSKTRILMD